MPADIYVPSMMKIGGGSIQQLPQILSELGVIRPFIIADPIMAELGVTDKLKTMMAEQQIHADVFSNVMPEPDDRSIIGAVEQVTRANADCLIAIGGGSAIDSAKAIALLASHGGHIRDYKVPYVIHQQSMPLIAIPTTAGTGSECTRVTVISDSESAEKMLCMGPGLMPKVAIIDYELTLTVPFRVAADTGIDALTHAIEAWVSKKANPYSDQQAIAAMRMISANLIDACTDADNRAAKEAMMLGASLAGIAFSNASVALVHGMSRPLGVHFHVPHGMSNAMLLPAITEFSLAGASQRYADCARHMGLANVDDDDASCHAALVTFLKKVNDTLHVPSMSEFGIAKGEYDDKLALMAKQALASGSPANNPLVPDENAMIELYKQVYR
ncbi:iron-containing alcohol dehydrogenase [Aestuariibacter salexigens]|uniref:iron-containing alcohol dehydrogenase n=1 Tax=Aestuariibacter salexigens TaxID=226010 RepID=UPI00041CA9A4|nr:iron-containing alcohol dehydrogenase [Aestuariibacter salexigens]